MRAGWDWRDHATRTLRPCRLCRRPAFMRHAAGLPCHKVCFEALLATGSGTVAELPIAPSTTVEEQTMPYLTPKPVVDRNLSTAMDYAAEGLPVFLLGRTKRPVANCVDCRLAGIDHDRE